MAAALVAMPNPRSLGGSPPAEPTTTTTTTTTTATTTASFSQPAKAETPLMRPPSPSTFTAQMNVPQVTASPADERRNSGDSNPEHPGGRSQSTPMTRPASPPPKRTNSTGALPPFLAHGAVRSPPSFNQPLPPNAGSPLPDSRRPRSSENLPTVESSPESSPQQHPANFAGGSSYPHSMSVRRSEHVLYSTTDYDAMMRPKKRHKTSRACDECRRKKVYFSSQR